MNKGILYAAIAIVLFLSGGISGWSMAKRSSDRGVIKQQQSDAKKAVKHNADIRNLEKSLAKTMAKLKGFKDNSGCLDAPSDPEYLNGLQHTDSLTRP